MSHVSSFILQEKIMWKMTFSKDEVWALGLSFFPAVPIYQRRDGPIIMANASELPPEKSEEHRRPSMDHISTGHGKKTIEVPHL